MFVQSIDRIDNFQPAHPGNGVAQPNQLVPVKLISTAEAVDDPRNRFSGIRVAFIMSELIVLDDAAVLVFSSGSSQIHDCLHQ